MRWEMLNENCIFAFVPEAEPLFGVYSLLSGEAVHHVCAELYGTSQIAAWKRRYRFLFETFDAVRDLTPYVFFDMLPDTFSENFSTERLRAYLLSVPDEERVFRQAEWAYICGATREEIRLALTDDVALYALYERLEEKCRNFLGFSSFIRQNKRYIEEYFALASELDTPALQDALRKKEPAINAFRMRAIENLKSSDGLKYSQELMGKTFCHRGPYERFFFWPSLLLPFASFRLFSDDGTPHNRQILICSIREPEKRQEDTVAALKALADETRYRILMLLAKSGPMNGQDIVQALKLAPSTISHHMAELKEHGLITEEQVKTAKCYGISKATFQGLLQMIAEDLKLSCPDGTPTEET